MNYWSISSIVLTQEAKRLGLEVEIISKDNNVFYIKGEGKKILFKSTDFGANSSLGLKISNDKELTYRILEKNNLPIAHTWYIGENEIEEIENLDISFPVIIKPLEEGHGNGVMMNILDIQELKEKLTESFHVYNKMIIQKQITGDEHRIIVLDGKVIAAITRIPAHIVGDGISSIKALIENENFTNSDRGVGNSNILSQIIPDSELLSFIKKKGFSLKSVPDLGEYIQLRGNSNISSGGTFVDILDNLSQDIKEASIKATQALQLGISGVDIISSDYTKKLSETNGIILEVNSTPGIGNFKENIVAKKIIQNLFFK